MDRTQLENAVRDALRQMLADAAPSELSSSPAEDSGPRERARYSPGQRPFDAKEFQRIKAATPSRLGQGRTGTRYLTDISINLRAEHAVALDAVHSEVPEDFPKQLGCIPVRTRCKDHAQYLLYPNEGRRLDDASKVLLEKEGSRGVDVQVICGDGLSAWAILENGKAILPALQQALEAQGFKTGKPIFVKFCRIGVQDEIGLLLGAKATVILVGERPGLGTGDSLSIYTAYGPKLEQDNAEKDCISNIRSLGIPPVDAAKECAALMRRTFDAKGGGVHLTRSGT